MGDPIRKRARDKWGLRHSIRHSGPPRYVQVVCILVERKRIGHHNAGKRSPGRWFFKDVRLPGTDDGETQVTSFEANWIFPNVPLGTYDVQVAILEPSRRSGEDLTDMWDRVPDGLRRWGNDVYEVVQGGVAVPKPIKD